MKPLVVLIRIILVGCFWSVFFLEGIRVIMLQNWRFDIVSYEHWQYAWYIWVNGWVISDAKEWAFVLIIVTFIPLWLTGWIFISMVPWERFITKAVMFPIIFLRTAFYTHILKDKQEKKAVRKVKKKPSYKEVRPRGTKVGLDVPVKGNVGLGANIASSPVVTPIGGSISAPVSTPKTDAVSSIFEHSLLATENEEDDFVFNFDAFDVTPKKEQEKKKEFEKPQRSRSDSRQDRDSRDDRNNKDRSKTHGQDKDRKDNRREKSRDFDKNRDDSFDKRKSRDDNKNLNKDRKDKPVTDSSHKPGSGNIIEIIKQKGYKVITGTLVNGTLVDFIGISQNRICLCVLDRENGDWLADEERFNDEEPLWFSESSHRISPVRKVDLARKELFKVLMRDKLNIVIDAYVIVQLGNIINAEDMFDIWKDMNITVTRIDRGTPKDIMLFNKGLVEAGEEVSSEEFDKLKKLVRSIR